MISDSVLIPRAKALITHARFLGIDGSGKPIYEVVSKHEAHNILTDAGRVAIHTYIYGTSAQRTSAGLGSGLNFIAISNDPATPVAGDTALASELTTNGLARAQGSVTLPSLGGNQTIISKVFTYTGVSQQGVQKTALFDASSNGKMAHEIIFPQRLLATNDQLTIQFAITAG
jgi:hypothetical protein